MKILRVRNVQEALPLALQLLDQEGIQRPSRNGPVLLGPSVTTIYERPVERVIFHPERDANPFFHLYEALWMLAGRNDVAGPVRYAANMANYSDDGKTFHGAYGYRWRVHFGFDQLVQIANELKSNDSRRCVLQMWDPRVDAGENGKDFPCNTAATFQIVDGALNLTVFCRSNDVIWGAYGANAVHFSFLLEYMALWIDVPVGTYTQVSVNWHGYLDTLEKVSNIRPDRVGFIENPYIDGRVYPARMFHCSVEEANLRIHTLLYDADHNFVDPYTFNDDEPFFSAAYSMLRAHGIWRNTRNYPEALNCLSRANQKNDWIVAGTEWLRRRYDAWQKRQ